MKPNSWAAAIAKQRTPRMYEMKPGVVTEMTASTQVSVRLGIEREREGERRTHSRERQSTGRR